MDSDIAVWHWIFEIVSIAIWYNISETSVNIQDYLKLFTLLHFVN